MNKLVLDIFCGSGSVSKVASSLGYNCISLDCRRRKGVCEPTIKADILKVPGTLFKSMPVFLMWCGVPCDIFSNASGGFHLDSNFQPKTDKALIHLEILKKTISIINETQPKFWVIENPRGKLARHPIMLDFLKNSPGYIYECTLSSYGFPTTKPTHIFTNYHDLKLKELDPFGRGAKNKVPRSFQNMTKVQRQKTPSSLIKSIINQFEKCCAH